MCRPPGLPNASQALHVLKEEEKEQKLASVKDSAIASTSLATITIHLTCFSLVKLVKWLGHSLHLANNSPLISLVTLVKWVRQTLSHLHYKWKTFPGLGRAQGRERAVLASVKDSAIASTCLTMGISCHAFLFGCYGSKIISKGLLPNTIHISIWLSLVKLVNNLLKNFGSQVETLPWSVKDSWPTIHLPLWLSLVKLVKNEWKNFGSQPWSAKDFVIVLILSSWICCAVFWGQKLWKDCVKSVGF